MSEKQEEKTEKGKKEKTEKPEKVEKTQAQIEAEIQAIYIESKAQVDEAIKAKNFSQALKIAIAKPPYDSKDENLISSYVNMVQSVLAQLSVEKVDAELLKQLSNEELRTLFDYVNKSLEYISDGKTERPHSAKINPNYLLKLFTLFTENRSKTIILLGIGNTKSLVRRLDKYTPNA